MTNSVQYCNIPEIIRFLGAGVIVSFQGAGVMTPIPAPPADIEPPVPSPLPPWELVNTCRDDVRCFPTYLAYTCIPPYLA